MQQEVRHKVEFPDPIEAYVGHPEGQERWAVCGCRKTAVLVRCCGALREWGLVVAPRPAGGPATANVGYRIAALQVVLESLRVEAEPG